MVTIEELLDRINRLEDDLKKTKAENVDLRNKLGIRGYLNPKPTANKSAEQMDTTSTEANGENATGSTPSEKKPPPFFITGIKSMSVFQSLIEEHSIITNEMKALNSGELKVQTPTVEEYRKLKAMLDKPNPVNEADRKKKLGALRYHTYRLPTDKPFTVYIRHIHPTTDVNDISSALLLHGHQTTNVINVQIRKTENEKTSYIKLPLFKVDMLPSENNRDIFKLTSILHHKIVVELPRKTTEVAQCKRCQQVGHSKNYCSKTPRCVKCGDKHEYKDCKLPRSAPAKCANCLGPHTANYRGCPVFKGNKTRGNSSTAVQRILAEKPPTNNRVYNEGNSYAQAVTAITNKATSKPENSNRPNELDEILTILKRLESSQDEIKSTVSQLNDRVNKLEADKPTPSPKRKVRKT